MNASRFVASYIDAWNRKDSRAVAEHLATDGTYFDIPVHQQMSRLELIEHLDEQFKLERNHYELVGEVLAGEHTIAFQYKVVSRDAHNDAREPEYWYGAEFIALRDGVAHEISDYYEQRDAQTMHHPFTVSPSASRGRRYAKSGLGAEQLAGVKAKITAVMEIKKAYLRASLTLPELADELDCSVNHVSQAINSGFGMSFFDYLNQYRVREAMNLLQPGEGCAPTVLNVALDVGFSSTSTFYVAFKKVTGKTPAQYRRALVKAL